MKIAAMERSEPERTSGARRVTGTTAVKGVHLGGVWAQWDKQLAEGRAEVEKSQQQAAATYAELSNTAASLAQAKASERAMEDALAIERSNAEESLESMECEKALRVAEGASIREEREEFQTSMAAMRAVRPVALYQKRRPDVISVSIKC